MPVRSTGRGFQMVPNNPVHTATLRNGEVFSCACARQQDHLVTSTELTRGSWKDTHPTLFS